MALRLIIAILTILLWAEASLAGNYSQRVFRSAYYLGRGDTGVAVADNHEAIFYNPAGLASGKGIYKETVLASPMVEMSEATKDLVRKISLEKKESSDSLADEMGNNQHLGFNHFSGIILRRVALGAFASNQIDILPSLSAESHGLPTVDARTVSNTGITFSIAEKFMGDHLLLGTTIKHFIARQQAGLNIAIADASDVSNQLEADDLIDTGSGTGADLGMILRFGKKAPFSLGLHIENVGDTKIERVKGESSDPDDLKQSVNIGMAVEPGTRSSKFRLLLDYRDVAGAIETNPLKNIHIGVEISFFKFIGITTGFNQGYGTFGGYMNLYAVRFDIGTYTEEVGARIGERPDTRYFFRLMVGF